MHAQALSGYMQKTTDSRGTHGDHAIYGEPKANFFVICNCQKTDINDHDKREVGLGQECYRGIQPTVSQEPYLIFWSSFMRPMRSPEQDQR